LVLIPLHNEVKAIIKNNFGNLPPKQSLRDFNDNLRKLGMLANIDDKVKGYKSNGKSKNKIKGYFKKYELLTSHCIRRSFATMYVGKIPNESLQSIMGWTSDKMVKLYNKTSKESHSEVLKNIWDNN
jgi:integrase